MKLLVVSNNYLSLNNNNGKVMRNYLNAFSNEELANFYISNELSDGLISSFNVRNGDALKSFLSFGIIKSNHHTDIDQSLGASIKYSPFKHLLRYIVWNSGFWKSKHFRKFVKEEKPDRIVTFLGNNPYLLKLSIKLAKQTKKPLILFIGENYPLKKFDYISKKTKPGLIFRLFHNKEKKYFKKALKSNPLIIFNSDYIKDEYIESYNINNFKVFYHLSSQEILPQNPESKVILYAGNLGLGRIDALIDFANILGRIDNTYKVKIFSNVNQNDIQKLLEVKNIDYNPFIKNDILLKEYDNAFGFVHVEKEDCYNNEDLKFAFSTKIADIICTSKPFIVYAPKSLACCKYLMNYSDNFIAANKDELKIKLQTMLTNSNLCCSSDLLRKNHSLDNSVLIKNYIENTGKE